MDIEAYGMAFYEGRKILKIVHLTTKSRCMTSGFMQNIDKWRFQDHTVVVHDDDAVDQLLLKKYWPEFPMLRLIERCTIPCSRPQKCCSSTPVVCTAGALRTGGFWPAADRCRSARRWSKNPMCRPPRLTDEVVLARFVLAHGRSSSVSTII